MLRSTILLYIPIAESVDCSFVIVMEIIVEELSMNSSTIFLSGNSIEYRWWRRFWQLQMEDYHLAYQAM